MARGYKATCPECDGHNLYVTPDNGVEHCFNCGYTKGARNESVGQLLKVSENLAGIRQYYRQCAAYYHACLTPEARAYLHTRGITDRIIDANQIGYCPAGPHPLYTDSIARDAGIATNGGSSVLASRIIFPYISPDGEVTDLRGRSLDPEAEVRYKGPYGRAAFRGADEWPYVPQGQRPPTGATVVITEGEIKALVCQQIGVSAVALPGINTWRWRLRSLYQQQTRVIMFDSQADRAVAENVYAAVDTLAQRLGECNILFLPLSGSKMDVDTYILTKGPKMFMSLLGYSLPYTNWAVLMRRHGYVPRSSS
jgi:DNA primase